MAVMDLKLVERLLSSNDTRRMGDAAKDLGVLLTTRASSQLVHALDALDRVHHEDDFGRGFLVALRHVFHAFSAALEREQSDAELTRLAEREGVRDVLVAFAEGSRLPSQIAERTGRQKSQITALLRYMESVDLIEADEPSSAEDGRVRPRVLTTRGAVLARRLADHSQASVVADVADTVTVVVESVAALVARQHVARADLAEVLGRRLPTAAAVRALEALEVAARDFKLAVSRDETLWFVEAQLQDVVADHLMRATEGDQTALRALLPALTTGARILVRTGQQRQDAWGRLKQVHGLDPVEIIGPGEARLGREARAEGFDVLYDSGTLVELDLGSSARQHFIEPASTRSQLCLKQSMVAESFKPVVLEG